MTPDPTRPAYHADARLTSLEVQVLESADVEGGPTARVSATVLYPGGGGQPADHGTLAGVDVLEASPHPDGGWVLKLSAPVAPGPARMTLDWARRFDHMQQHTAQHLITAVAADRFGWHTTSFHLGEHTCHIELDVATLSAHDLAALEEEVAARVREGLPVRARYVTLEAYRDLDVRSRGLPAHHTGDVRLVEIQGLDTTTCGGTHVSSTAELEAVCLLGTESMRGGTRLFWVAGGRLRRRLGAWEARGRELRSVLGVGDAELVQAALSREAALRDALKAGRRLQTEAASARAQALVGEPGPVVVAHLEGWDPAGVRAVAQAFGQASTAGVALLTCDGDPGLFFALAAGSDFSGDLGTLGATVAGALEGRGGGVGRLFQGKAPSAGGLKGAVSALREAVEGTSP